MEWEGQHRPPPRTELYRRLAARPPGPRMRDPFVEPTGEEVLTTGCDPAYQGVSGSTKAPSRRPH